MLDQLKNYQFPCCSLGGDHENHQLSKICIDNRCQKKKLFEPHCAICEEYCLHKIQNHQTKSLKIVLKELIQLIGQNIQDNDKANQIIVLEHQFLQIAQFFKAQSEKCEKLSNDIYKSLDIFRMTINKESQKQIELSNIINYLFNEKCESDKVLRNVTQILNQTLIIDQGTFALNDSINEKIKLTLLKNSEKYQQVMKDSYQKINKIVDSLLEISVLEGFYEQEDNIYGEEELMIINQSNLQFIKEGDVQLEQKKSLDRTKKKLEQEIRDHIISCQCNNCEEFLPNQGIGNWRITDCYYGKKLSNEWIKIYSN